MTRYRSLLGAVISVGLFAGAASACPMCKDTITDESKAATAGADGPKEGLPGGFNVSVVSMLLGAFAVMGFVAHVIVKGVRGTNVGAPAGGGFPVRQVTPGAGATPVAQRDAAGGPGETDSRPEAGGKQI